MAGICEEFREVNRATNWEEGDFVSPDGIHICGLCAKPKETPEGWPIVHGHQLQQRTRREETDEERAERIQRNRKACFSGVFSEEGERSTFANLAQDTDPYALDAARQLVASFADNVRGKQGRGLILYGANGRGKTTLAGCICNELLGRGYRCLFTSTRAIRDRMGKTYGGASSVLEGLRKFDLVVLDDLFKDKGTSAGQEAIFEIVDALYKMRVSTIVTTNVSKDTLAMPNTADKAVVERLKERCERVEVTGPNRRQRRVL